jgi:predicted dehydrogenase
MSDVDTPVNFGVVGLGMGHGRARICTQTPGAHLAAVCDIDQARGQKAVDEYGTEWIRDYDELLRRDDVEVIFLLTPSGMHAEMGVAAAKAGKHVVSTKPIDVRLEAIDELIAACDQAGVMCACDFDERYSPAKRRVKRIIDAGLFGPLIMLEARLKWYRNDEYFEGWHGTWKYDGGGSLMNQSVHLIDVLQWFGGPVKDVHGRMGIFNHDIETEDAATASVTFANGALGVVVGTTTFPESRVFEVEVHGPKGAAALGSINGEYVKFLDEGVEEPPAPDWEPSNVVEDVVSHLRRKTPLACTGVEARKSVELILAIYTSAIEMRTVELPLAGFTPPKT